MRRKDFKFYPFTHFKISSSGQQSVKLVTEFSLLIHLCYKRSKTHCSPSSQMNIEVGSWHQVEGCHHLFCGSFTDGKHYLPLHKNSVKAKWTIIGHFLSFFFLHFSNKFVPKHVMDPWYVGMYITCDAVWVTTAV